MALIFWAQISHFDRKIVIFSEKSYPQGGGIKNQGPIKVECVMCGFIYVWINSCMD